MADITIGSRVIGNGHPCFIIAEAGVNHNGDLSLAKRLIDTAAESGADAVKFQTFQADFVVTKNAKKASYQKSTTGKTESQYDMIHRLELPFKAFAELKRYAESKKILFLSTPFDRNSVDFLEKIKISAYKIPSGEIDNPSLLAHIARKHKPIILSTGMSTLGEIERSIRLIFSEGGKEIALLHCITAYPARVKDVNLRAMETMRCAFKVPVGFSDHTLGISIPIAAVSMGACILEKHFTLDKTLPGPDHRASLDPIELQMMVRAIRDVESAKGNGIKNPSHSEIKNKRSIRRSIVAARDIPKNAIIGEDSVSVKRPGTGISPVNLSLVLGSVAKRNIKNDEVLSWNDIIIHHGEGE